MSAWAFLSIARTATFSSGISFKLDHYRGARSQAAIFRAAAHEFARRGYDAAGVDRIAARAHVNKAMLYYHYGSKQGLYVEVLRDMFRAVGARTRAIADG